MEAFANDGRPTTQSVITEIKIIHPSMNVSVAQQVDNPNNRSVTVTNGGDALLDDVALTVTACSQPSQVTSGDGDKKLSPGESWSYTCTADQKSQVNVRVYATDPLAERGHRPRLELARLRLTHPSGPRRRLNGGTASRDIVGAEGPAARRARAR